MIVPIEKKHAREVGELHYKYTKSLLRDLGRRMCIVFYETVLKHENNFGFVYIENFKVLGFILGTKDNSRLFIDNRIRLEIIISLLRKPNLIFDLLSQQRKRFSSCAERCYSAVDRSCRKKGIALKLYAALNQEFRERGISYFEDSVDTDNINSLAVQRFFGAKIKHKFVERGITRYRLYTELSQ